MIFDKKAVEMRDFSLRFGNIPNDHRWGGKELCLAAALREHLEGHIDKALEQKAKGGLTEKEEAEMGDGRVWEIVDITYHKNDLIETDLLCELDRIDRAKKTIIR